MFQQPFLCANIVKIPLSLGNLCDLICQVIEQGMHFRVGTFCLAYLTARMHNRRMVPAAQVSAYFFETVFGKAPGQVHTDLPRFGNALAALFALEVGQANIEMPCDYIDDIGDANISGSGFYLTL